MNRHNSAWTGKAPRDMQSAFGPYTSRHVHPMPCKRRLTLRDILTACAIGAALGYTIYRYL